MSCHILFVPQQTGCLSTTWSYVGHGVLNGGHDEKCGHGRDENNGGNDDSRNYDGNDDSNDDENEDENEDDEDDENGEHDENIKNKENKFDRILLIFQKGKMEKG